jgi:hypothetical protein
VLSDTKTPASDATAAILRAQNNYWLINFSALFVVNDRTDLKVNYFYYQADNYKNILLAGVPYGAGADEHGIAATLTRRISKNMRLTLKYAYYLYDDATFGGNTGFDGHLIYSTLQYRF